MVQMLQVGAPSTANLPDTLVNKALFKKNSFLPTAATFLLK